MAFSTVFPYPAIIAIFNCRYERGRFTTVSRTSHDISIAKGFILSEHCKSDIAVFHFMRHSPKSRALADVCFNVIQVKHFTIMSLNESNTPSSGSILSFSKLSGDLWSLLQRLSHELAIELLGSIWEQVYCSCRRWLRGILRSNSSKTQLYLMHDASENRAKQLLCQY